MSDIVNIDHTISKVLYGISEIKSIDITDKIKSYFKKYSILDTSVNINELAGIDPYFSIPKKLFIYQNNNDTNPIIIPELNCALTSIIIYKEQHTVQNVIIEKKEPNILIYIVYHDTASYKFIEKYKNKKYVKLFHNESTIYFESNIFRYLDKNRKEWIDKDYVGILTYSFECKTGRNLDTVYNKVKLLINNHHGDDLLILYGGNIQLSYTFHGSIEQVFNYTLPLFGIPTPINYSTITAFFCNYWITKSKLMDEYVKFAVEYMNKLDDSHDAYLQSLLNANNTNYKGKLSSEKLLQITGLPYYTSHCFVMERLPCVFFWNKKIKIRKIF